MLSVVIRQQLGAFALDIAFEGPAEGVTVLFGPSGAGKSATLAAIGGATHPDAGRVAIGSRVLVDVAKRIDVPPRRRHIGWVHQDARLFPHMPVRANLLYGQRRARGRNAIGFADVVAVLGIAPLLRRRVAELSGGERQRVALGRALLSQPDLLLLDEPLAALDEARKREILAFIARLKADFRLPMIYVTHSLAEVRAVADHVVSIDRGRVLTDRQLGVHPANSLLGIITDRDDASATMSVAVAGRHYTVPLLDGQVGDTITIGVDRIPG